MNHRGRSRKNDMLEGSNNFKGVFGGQLRWHLPWLSGVALLVLVLSTTCVFAGPPPDFPPWAVPSATNGGPVNPALASPAATNGSPADATNAMAALDGNYRLSIGDRLSFKIVEDNEDSKPLQVTDSGDIEFPYIGRIAVVGQTCRELAAELKSRYEQEYYYHATVIVAVDFKAKSEGKVYLIGAVLAPGPQEVPSDEQFTLSKAILRAGGFNDFADQHNVRVTRKEPGQGADGNMTYTVDVGKILSQGRTDLDLVLEPGDFVFISEKMIRF
jgi:polysaccharide export outer membrane protein